MFIRKSQYKRYKNFWANCRRYDPLMLRTSASRYRELALLHSEKTAEHIVTSIRMLKQAIVAERLLDIKGA